jgi:hypothetical protein
MTSETDPTIISLETGRKVTDTNFINHLQTNEKADAIVELVRTGLDGLPPELEIEELTKKVNDMFCPFDFSDGIEQLKNSEPIEPAALKILKLYIVNRYPAIRKKTAEIPKVIMRDGAVSFFMNNTIFFNNEPRAIIDCISPACDEPALLATKKIIERIRLLQRAAGSQKKLEPKTITENMSLEEKINNALHDYIQPSNDGDPRPGLKLPLPEIVVLFKLLQIETGILPLKIWSYVKNNWRRVEYKKGELKLLDFKIDSLKVKAAEIIPGADKKTSEEIFIELEQNEKLSHLYGKTEILYNNVLSII